MGLGVWGFRFWVLGFGFGVWGSGFGVLVLGFGVWVLSLRVPNLKSILMVKVMVNWILCGFNFGTHYTHFRFLHGSLAHQKQPPPLGP